MKREYNIQLNKLTLFVLIISVLCGCSGPEARFTTDKKEYNGGDTVYLKNLSLAADSFVWLLNDREIGHAQDLNVVLAANAKGPQVFGLKAMSGDKSSVATQTIMATTVLGTITAWSTFGGMEIISVSQNGEETVGLTSSGYQNDPGCSAAGCVTLLLPPGTYTIDGRSEITRSRRVVELAADECQSIKMH